MNTKLFFDTEFTGLHSKTTLVSIGFISEFGKTFYAEFTDYDKSQVDDWIQTNVIRKTWVYIYDPDTNFGIVEKNSWADIHVFGDKDFIASRLRDWLSQFESIEMWSDCMAYDWVLFNDIFGSAFDIPKNIFYIPFDICTVFKEMAINPDINRESFACDAFSENGEPLFFNEQGERLIAGKHNAMWDAKIIKRCYEKLCVLKVDLKTILLEASNWENQMTSEERSTLAYFDARLKVIDRIHEKYMNQI